jgi:hypothetical protein
MNAKTWSGLLVASRSLSSVADVHSVAAVLPGGAVSWPACTTGHRVIAPLLEAIASPVGSHDTGLLRHC